ncbi:MAG TPA: DUF4258 domain-containing protein [Myxococcaceae bacterium]|nr:DUF4258 domain-containing protein [Myxococcaceae bacterium]
MGLQRVEDERALVEGYDFSQHALKRMRGRGLPAEALRAALLYGRVIHVRAADHYVIGHREIRHYATQGIDLAAYEGVQVVCSPEGTIVTVYRNRDLSQLRPRRRKFRPFWHHRARH